MGVVCTKQFRAASVSAQANVVEPLRARPHIEQELILVHGFAARELLQRRDVIEDVDASTVSADDQVVIARVNQNVVNANRRQA